MILRFNKLKFTLEIKGEIVEAHHENNAIAIIVPIDSQFLLMGSPLTIQQVVAICPCHRTQFNDQKCLEIKDIYDIEF